jgi:uncharacterized membrane protein YagU involved in acid resistance
VIALRRPKKKSPAAAVLQGLAAGALGNAAFTLYQRFAQGGGEEEQGPPQDWSEAPPPAQVGQRVAEGVFRQEVPVEKAGLVTHVVHWLYGTTWGAFYGLVQESVEQPVASGVALAGAVVATDYTLLPAMNLYKPPWRYPATTLAKDFGHHLVYGLSVAGAYRALDALRRAR